MRLSPLNHFTIQARLNQFPAPPAKRSIEQVIMYRCPECHELHDDEDDAEDCCKITEGQARCPVCDEKYESHRSAADCCLWKDLDAPTRWAIADAV